LESAKGTFLPSSSAGFHWTEDVHEVGTRDLDAGQGGGGGGDVANILSGCLNAVENTRRVRAQNRDMHLWVLVGVVRRSILRRRSLNFNSSTMSHAPNYNMDPRTAYKYLIREIYKIRKSTTVTLSSLQKLETGTKPQNPTILTESLSMFGTENVRNQGTNRGKYRPPSQRICDDAHLFETNLPESIIHRIMNERKFKFEFAKGVVAATRPSRMCHMNGSRPDHIGI
jgi:hypothetical protein